MNKLRFFSAITIIIALLTGCKDDALNAGQDILPADDNVYVGVDTFGVRSTSFRVDYIYSLPDSVLLGESDTPFGTLHAEVLTQLACPIDFHFPQSAVFDSVLFYVYYSSWYGNGSSPLSISIYELDKATFDYGTAYTTNIDLNEYWSGEDSTRVCDEPKVIIAGSPTDSILQSTTNTYMSYFTMKASDKFVDKLFSNTDYSSQEAFNQHCKGLYLTTDFGSSTVLYVNEITLTAYYHYTYQKAGEDTLSTTEDIKAFYANSDVRKVNRITYLNEPTSEISALDDSVNYIVSPAQYYSLIKIPMRIICDTINGNINGKRPYVNLAQLTVEVLYDPNKSSSEKTYADWAEPAKNMLLIKENSVERFFEKHELPHDTVALLASLSSTTEDGETKYKYVYSLSQLLTDQLRLDQMSDMLTDTLNMYLVPVSVELASSSSGTTLVTSIKPEQCISATTIRSAQSTSAPTKVEVVYSGF